MGYSGRVTRRRQQPVALTIAGSDSGGGAGIQADLKTFAALGVHGTSAITCLTAQNPVGVRAVHPCSPRVLEAQIEAVLEELPPGAVKTGMLYSAALIRRVQAVLARLPETTPVVVDPVMVSTSGARLLQPSAVRALVELVARPVTLLTPNLDEAALLLGRPLTEPEHLREAARALHGRFGCATLLKGGHLPGVRDAMDVFWDGREEWLLSAPFVRGVSTHGTGCTYSAAITAGLALGRSLVEAVEAAKQFVTGAIAHGLRVARHDVLNPFWSE